MASTTTTVAGVWVRVLALPAHVAEMDAHGLRHGIFVSICWPTERIADDGKVCCNSN